MTDPEIAQQTERTDQTDRQSKNFKDPDGIADMLASVAEIGHWVEAARGYAARAAMVNRSEKSVLSQEAIDIARLNMGRARAVMTLWAERDAARGGP